MGVLIAPTGFAAEKFDVEGTEVFDPFGIITGDFIGEFGPEGTVTRLEPESAAMSCR
jgi:hypothetical protein